MERHIGNIVVALIKPNIQSFNWTDADESTDLTTLPVQTLHVFRYAESADRHSIYLSLVKPHACVFTVLMSRYILPLNQVLGTHIPAYVVLQSCCRNPESGMGLYDTNHWCAQQIARCVERVSLKGLNDRDAPSGHIM